MSRYKRLIDSIKYNTEADWQEDAIVEEVNGFINDIMINYVEMRETFRNEMDVARDRNQFVTEEQFMCKVEVMDKVIDILSNKQGF